MYCRIDVVLSIHFLKRKSQTNLTKLNDWIIKPRYVLAFSDSDPKYFVDPSKNNNMIEHFKAYASGNRISDKINLYVKLCKS